MLNDKKPIKVFNGTQHRIVGKMPDFCSKYGLWIINGNTFTEFASGYFRLCPVRQFEFYSIAHFIGGTARLWLKETGEQKLTLGEMIVITPGTENRYGGEAEPYSEDAIRFCGPVADMMAAAGIIKSGAFMLGKNRILLPIIKMINDPSRETQLRANIMLQNLLIEMFLQKREIQRENKIENLTRQIQNNLSYWWTVDELAELAGISSELLRKRFYEHTGMRPKEYIEESKLRASCELLVNSNLSIRDIAKHFGYSDPYHFSRRFKIRIGVSPDNYRQAHRYSKSRQLCSVKAARTELLYMG